MYVETPVVAPAEVITDPTLDHLHTLRELLSGQGLWCRSEVTSVDLFGSHSHCIMGLAVLAVGGDPYHMSTRCAIDYIKKYDKSMYPALSSAAREHAGCTGDPVYINDKVGYENVVRMVDRAIEIRKAEL